MPPESGVESKGQRQVAAPTGTVTFLFSDIEGSTARWERHGAAMEHAVKCHDALMRSTIEQCKGHVFKTVGDAFCAVFARTSDATAAAVDAQRKLSSEDFSGVDGLRVRMALHVGEALEARGDFFGPTVNRVARLMSIGHGGQVLLSGVTRDLAHNELPTGVSLIDLGSHRLRDLAEPEHVWQITIPGLQSVFPSLNSLDIFPNNLPLQVTTFRGRERDLIETKTLLTQHRLVTLFGAGGIGKTRLALQVGADLLEQFPDGVWFADLGPIADPALVSSVVARILGISQVGDRRIDETILQWLKGKSILLVLDNCEHLLEAAAFLADAIHRNCPSVRILATSRQALGIEGEEVWRVSSLAVPQQTANLSSLAAVEYGAVAVFVDRASSADKLFQLTDDNAPVVSEICRRLDGIPLAIELAAARVKVLSIPNLALRLGERFKILTGGTRTAEPRQKTLTALIDWSYDLLSQQEQAMFNRVSVFAGGFTLDAAASVCGAGDELEVLDLLASLTDKSLLVADTGESKERYRLLESTRAYALEKLTSGGEREQLARRHAEYFRDLAKAADASWSYMPIETWLAALELELDNFRTALEWTQSTGKDAVLGGMISGALDPFWQAAGLVVEGRKWIDQGLASVDEDSHPSVAAKLWLARAGMMTGNAKYEASNRSAVLFELAGDYGELGWALIENSWGLMKMGRLDESLEVVTRALSSMKKTNDRRGIANCLNIEAAIMFENGDLNRSRELFGEAIAEYKRLGHKRATFAPLSNLAELEFRAGNVKEALRLVGEALEVKSGGKLPASLYNNRAAYSIGLGEFETASSSAWEGLRLARGLEDAFQCAVSVQHLALLAALRHDAKTAARLKGYVNGVFAAIGYERESTENWSYERLNASLREQMSEVEIENLATEGGKLTESQAIDEALKVESRPNKSS